MEVAGVLDYDFAMFFFGTFGNCWCFPCVPVFVRTWMRVMLRKQLGLTSRPVTDFFAVCFCPCCATGQEALHVDAAAGASVRCCFNLDTVTVHNDMVLSTTPVQLGMLDSLEVR